MDASPSQIEIAPGRFLPASVMQFTFARSGGPGGQNVNKVSSKAILTIALADLALVLPAYAMDRLSTVASMYLTRDALQIASDESRSQHANRATCLEKLRRVMVEALHRPKHRRKTKPSYGSKQRRLEAKRITGQRKAERRGFDGE